MSVEINRKILCIVFFATAMTLFAVIAIVKPDLIRQAIQTVAMAIYWMIGEIVKLIFRALFGE